MIRSLTPILIAKNLDETIAFYRDKLNFSVDYIFKEPGIDAYASLYREEIFINFREGTPPKNPSSFGGLSIEVEDIDQFYQELVTKNALPEKFPREFSCIREHPPEDKEYGVRDMFLVDLNGYILNLLTPL